MRKEEKKAKYSVRLSQKVLFYDPSQKKFLLVKVKDKYDWYCKNIGPWEFIGGSFEANETIPNSLNREIKEEIGDIKFEISGIINTNEFIAPSGHKIVLIYLAKYLDGGVKLSDEHSEYRWVSAEEVENGKEYREWLKTSISKAAKYIENNNALDSWKRCQADFENYKKDQEKGREEFIKFSKMDMISQILPVLDNFEISLAHVPEEKKGNGWVEGITHIKRQIKEVLRNNNVEEIAVKVGDEFDPEIHEAVTGKGEKVGKILQKGYKLNGRVLRAARVEVG